MAETADAAAATLLATRSALSERQAVAIYRQGEAARAAGELRAAVAHFGRVAALAKALAEAGPAHALLATAQFDAATTLVQLQDWPAAATALQAFRQRHPAHPLQAQLPSQLAAVYLGQQHWSAAAGEFERIAANSSDAEVARSARWQVAELQDKALAEAGPVTASAQPAPPQPAARQARGTRRSSQAQNPINAPAWHPAVSASVQAWERYLAAHPQPLEPALQARLRLATLLAAQGQTARATVLHQQLLQAERAVGDARTPRSRLLAGQAALALAEPSAAAYRSVALVEPLARQLKLKQTRLQMALDAYTLAAETGVAPITTAASFHTATLYQDFGQALMQSQRPKKLSALEREQYEVMLEEQAFPFEEKAIALHETNAARSAGGLWDPWVQRSFDALAKLKPARFGKTEQWPGADSPGLPASAQSVLTAAQALRTNGQSAQALAQLEAAVGIAAAASPQTAQKLSLNPAETPAQTPALNASAERTPASAPLWTALGLLYRETGRFADAQRAYETALAAAPDDLAAQRNLAVLHDLYLDEPQRALPLFQRCLALAATAAPADAAVYTRWVAEVQRRQPAPDVVPDGIPTPAPAPITAAQTAVTATPTRPTP